MRAWRGVIEEYRGFLLVEQDMPVVTLLEGNTPLVRAGSLAQRLGGEIEIYLKLEGLNPTGSFKDRGMTLAISKAVHDGADAVVCASTGNTAAFEIVDELGGVPDWLVLPVGNAGNITAYWRGFGQYGSRRPRMAGYQAAGAAPIVLGRPVDNPQTLASAIRIGNPANWKGAKEAADDSGGFIDSVSDREIMEAYRLMARVEGVYAEPSSCASVAGLMKMIRLGRFCAGQRIVAVLTGHGLKDPESAMAGVDGVSARCLQTDGGQGADGVVNADLESVRRFLGV